MKLKLQRNGRAYFKEDYMRGAYDKPCPECRGNKIVLYIDWDQADKKDPMVVAYREHLDEEDRYRAICEAERRAGA
jgi:hypothetical protein